MLVVPFGARTILGVVTGLCERSEVSDERLLAPLRALELGVPEELVGLARWLAAEYCSTLARALGLVLPPGATRRLGGRRRAVRRAPGGEPLGGRIAAGTRLSDEQLRALEPLLGAISSGCFEQRLLHGVTASGKTEVYLRAAAEALARDRGAIVMVPEIALTPQIVSRFTERFGETVAVLHSGLTTAQRYTEWRRLREGDARICVGPRSAVFAPVGDLGLIVVDEEHESSYKHEGDLRYDAREVAAERARRSGAVLLLGSATPRPESVLRVPAARLLRRVDGRPLPPVEVLDMRGQPATLHPDSAQALAEVREPRRQGDRAAEPPRLVELPLLPLLRGQLGVPGMRRHARPAPRRPPAGLPPLRLPRAGPRPLPALLLECRRPPRRGHRAARPRPRRGVRRGRLPGLPPRCRRRARRRCGRDPARLPGGSPGSPDRDPDGRQGSRLPRRPAGAGARCRRHPALPRLPCRGAHLRADRPARRTRRAGRARAGAGADRDARGAGDRPRRRPRQRRLPGRRARAPAGARLPAVLAPGEGRVLVPGGPRGAVRRPGAAGGAPASARAVRGRRESRR